MFSSTQGGHFNPSYLLKGFFWNFGKICEDAYALILANRTFKEHFF
jgi:hypothetical protein